MTSLDNTEKNYQTFDTEKKYGHSHNNKEPIGLFDSSIGGLSIYQHLHRLLPNENYIYYADTLNVPYGGRDKENIIELTLKAVERLYNLNCKLIVIACNSASACALQIARKRFTNIPIVGLVPALKPAVLASKTRQVAVLATQATLDGHLLQGVINKVALPNQTIVHKYYEPTLVPWVEAGMPKTSPTIQVLHKLLDEMSLKNIDHLVLGCTHYPFFKHCLQEYIASHRLNISVIDSGMAIAFRVEELLITHQLQATNIDSSHFSFYTSHYTENLQQSLNLLLQKEIQVSF